MNEDSPAVRARSLIAAGRPREARALLEQNQSIPQCAVRLRELLIGEGNNTPATRIAMDLARDQGPEAHVSRSFLALLGGDPQSALDEARAALSLDGGLATAHNHAGRALNNLGRPGRAAAALRRAIEADHEYPEAWHNLGHVLRVRGDLAGACAAYERALELAPAYRSARLNLGKTLFHQEKITQSLQCFEALLERDPDDAEALVDSGLALHLLGELDRARQHYDRALRLEPENPVAYCYLGILLNELQDAEGAAAALEHALRLDPNDIEAWTELAGTHELCNRLAAAATAVERGLAVDPGHPALQLEAAKLDRRHGRFDAAVRRLRSIDPLHVPARLRKPYYFELANALDRCGECEEAFDAFTAGNRLAANDVRRRRLDAATFPASCARIESWIGSGAPGLMPQAPDPQEDRGANLCFLVGFPRSGTTLLDMMLDAHPAVASIEEQATLEQVITRLHALPGGYPAAMASIDGERLAALRQYYREECTRHLGHAKSTLIVDKMPMRFMHAGLINRMFPRARILFALRHPCDVVLSNFMQQYPSSTDFLIHFDTLDEGAAMFDRTFRLWHALEALLCLDVQYLRYEDLVEDTPGTLEKACRFLGIEADAAMLDTGARLETRERVTTPSYQQVGEPIYRRAAGRWKRYRRHLESCLPLLAPHARRFGYEVPV